MRLLDMMRHHCMVTDTMSEVTSNDEKECC